MNPALHFATNSPVVVMQVGENARFGGTGLVEKSDVDKLVGLARHANVFVKISAFYALGTGKAPYNDLVPLVHRLLDACA